MKKTLRTFVAVEISEPIRAAAEDLVASLSATAANVKWVEPHNLHVSLKFLGEVSQREIVDVCRAVERGAKAIDPFTLEIRGAGAFPTAARPRTVWIGAGEGADKMIVLHDRVETALAELGYREEHRRFQSHLTIGRVRGAGPGIAELGHLLQQHADDILGSVEVRKATVFCSTLTSDGPIYEVLGTARLGGT